MINFDFKTSVFVYQEPIALAASFTKLYLLTREELAKNPLSGSVFIFLNKKRTACKALHYDGTGFFIYYKKLDHGRFPDVKQLTANNINQFFRGEINIQKRSSNRRAFL